MSEHPTSLSLLSVFISIATISFSSSMICFDYDLDPVRRMFAEFYGYVPNSSGKRNIVFFAMILFTACHVSIKMIGVAMLAVVNPLFVVVFLGGDLSVYLLIKAARGDLRYWMNLDGATSWIVSFLFRVIVKQLVDFTAIVHFRVSCALSRSFLLSSCRRAETKF